MSFGRHPLGAVALGASQAGAPPPPPDPPIAAISNQTLSGQILNFSGTYSGGEPDAATVTIPAAATPNGAITIGPLSATYSAGAWSITVTVTNPGDYDAPVITLSNGAGSDSESGAAFTVMEIDGEPQAPNPGETIEATTAADVMNATVAGLLGTLVEVVTSAHTQAATPGISRQVSETSPATDAQASTSVASRAVADTITAADAQGAGTVLSPSSADSSPATDQGTATASSAAGVAEIFAAADTQDGVVAVGGNNYEDLLNPVELQTSQAEAVRGLAETAPATDSYSVSLGRRSAMAEVLSAQEALSNLVVIGTVTVEGLAALTDMQDGVAGFIIGNTQDVLVLTEQQFRSVLAVGGVLELMAIDDEMVSLPLITPTTVVDRVVAEDLFSRLTYPRPPVAGSAATRRFIVYYK